MAQTLGELVLKLQLDQQQFNTQLKKIEADVKKTSGTFDKMGLAMRALPIAAAAAALFQLGKAIAISSSNATEAAQKFNVVFSGIQVKANKMADELAKSFALGNTEVRSMLSQVGNVLQGFGFASEASLELSGNITSLAADLISFTNNSMGVAGATDAITKAMLGEREQMKSLGIAILDADLIKIARDQGKNYEAMTKQEKALLTYNQILKLSANAVGDFARSWDSPANILRAVNSRLEDMKEKLGDQLTPALANLGSAFLSSTKEGGALTFVLSGIVKGVAYAAIGIANFIRLMDLLSIAMMEPGKQKALEKELDGYKKIGAIVRENHKRQLGENENLEKGLERLAAQNDATAAADLAYLRSHKNGVSDAAAALSDLKKRQEETQIAIALSGKALDEKVKKEITDNGTLRKNQNESTKRQAFKLAMYQDEIGAITDLSKASDAFAADFAAMTDFGKFKTVIDMTASAASAIQNMFSNVSNSVSALSKATTDNLIAGLDEQMQAEKEAAGVAEETALQKAQREVDEAGAAVTVEQQKALKKAQIEDKYQKNKANLEYKAAMEAYDLQVAMAGMQVLTGTLMAVSQGMGAPWPLTIPMAIAQGVAAAAAGAINLAAVVAAKPKAPKFEMGGIVPGSMFSGDNVVARVNSGEMVLNQQQQANLFQQANSGGGGETTIHNVINLDGRVLYENIQKATFDGRLLVASRAVV